MKHLCPYKFLTSLLWIFPLLSNADDSAEPSVLGSSNVKLAVPSSSGSISAWMHVTAIPGFLGHPSNWTTYVHTAYFPGSGNGWTGVGFGWNSNAQQDALAQVDGCILGMYYDSLRNGESLRISVSTTKYPVGLTNVSTVIQAELANYTNSTQRFRMSPPYRVELERILGAATFRDYDDTNKWGGHLVLASTTRPSKFKELTVEGTNAVVSLEIGTNTLARIAFNKDVVPVWATTNGVSIGPIPTNCVFYSDVVSNKVVTRVVY